MLALDGPLTDWVMWVMPGVWVDEYSEEGVSFSIVTKMLDIAEWVAAGGMLVALVVALAAAAAFVVWGVRHLLIESGEEGSE